MSLPVVSDNVSHYLSMIRAYPILSQEEELELVSRMRDESDVSAAHALVCAHLKLVVKIALTFRGYGLALADLISEGNIGLMKAVKKFNPSKGCRLATYAVWWIKAALYEYVYNSFSIVKLGTTIAKKKLFYNLKRIKNNIATYDECTVTDNDTYKRIAEELNVSESDVIDVEAQISGTVWLDDTLGDSSDTRGDLRDVPKSEGHELSVIESHDMEVYRDRLMDAIRTLNDRDQDIFIQRKLSDPPKTLSVLSKKYSVSPERIRQLEEGAMKKVKHLVLERYSA